MAAPAIASFIPPALAPDASVGRSASRLHALPAPFDTYRACGEAPL